MRTTTALFLFSTLLGSVFSSPTEQAKVVSKRNDGGYMGEEYFDADPFLDPQGELGIPDDIFLSPKEELLFRKISVVIEEGKALKYKVETLIESFEKKQEILMEKLRAAEAFKAVIEQKAAELFQMLKGEKAVKLMMLRMLAELAAGAIDTLKNKNILGEVTNMIRSEAAALPNIPAQLKAALVARPPVPHRGPPMPTAG